MQLLAYDNASMFSLQVWTDMEIEVSGIVVSVSMMNAVVIVIIKLRRSKYENQFRYETSAALLVASTLRFSRVPRLP